MKKLLKLDIKTIAIVVIGLILFFQECGGNKNKNIVTTKIDGKKFELLKHDIDTIEVVKTQTITKKGKDIYHDTTIYVPLNGEIDTITILKDYFAKNVYKDTLHLPDSLGYVFLTDTISKNAIASRIFKSNVKQRTIKETTIVKELPKAQLYFGFDGGFNKTDVVSNLGAAIMLKSKSDKIYKIGAGVNNHTVDGMTGTLSPYISGGIYWKLKLKK
jgi:hypothetical protein